MAGLLSGQLAVASVSEEASYKMCPSTAASLHYSRGWEKRRMVNT